MKNITLTFADVVSQIAGPETPIVEHPFAAQCGGAAFIAETFDPKSAKIIVADQSILHATDARSLAIAAHESYHIRRMQEGVDFYKKRPFKLSHNQTADEEQIVNGLAKAFLEPLIGDQEDWQDAVALFEWSNGTYDAMRNQKGMTPMQVASAQAYGAEIGMKFRQTIKSGPIAIARAVGKVSLVAGKSVGRAGLGLGKQGLEKAVVMAPTPQQVCQKAAGLGHGLKNRITRVKPGSRVEITATADEIAI
jgi:hypothetical protein